MGGSGSGKSYIAKQISNKFNIPHFDLDDIFWDNQAEEYGIKTPELERDNKLKKLVEQPSWIIEGVYFKWVKPSFKKAEKIFILNIPLSLQEERIWSRYEKRKLGEVTSAKKETLQSVIDLIDWNRRYNQEHIPNFIKDNEFKRKIIQLENNEDIFKYLV
ncbi:P-loop NTPase family protein [Bacillus andreraoultii]|uniref:hypothetical protein n=1 Tax=Bacillus andreraoultii TaxID=1499685 RepID=UPI00227F061F|nr:hypothetical protein [Bacillus andreraoultii]